MNDRTKAKLVAYLGETLGLTAALAAFADTGNLPLILRDKYEINECTVLGKKFLALVARDREITPAAIEKHAEWINQKTGFRSIFVFSSLAAYNRKRLIERRIPFVMPGSQMYLPDLAIDLREHIKRSRESVSRLSPACQVLVLAYLLRRINEKTELTATSLAQRFGYTKMTMSRALDELRTVLLAERSDEGKYGKYRFVLSGQELWSKVRQYLRTPVKKRVYLDEWHRGMEFQAGESALAQKTMLGHPKRAVWAITSREWKQIQESPEMRIMPEASKGMARAEFEIWHYDPRLLAEKPCVDPLSLVLSFDREPTDERLSLAIDELTRSFPWSTD